MTTLFLLLIGVMSLSLSPALFSNETIIEREHNDLIIGHRGAAHLAPENTISSIRAAMRAGVDQIEIDVQQTSDSIIVLMHDLTLERTTNGYGYVKNTKFSELVKLDAGSWFSNGFLNERVPTLEEAIEAINGQCKMIVEIKRGKNFYPCIEQNIVKILREKKAMDWVIVQSFDSDILKQVHSLEPRIELHKLLIGKIYGVPLILDNGISILDVEELNFVTTYSLNYRLANKKIIDRLHEEGKKVNAWTVNDADIISALFRVGIDGVITDNPLNV